MENQKLKTPAKNYSTSFEVAKPAKDVFNAVNNVTGWWSENIHGSTNKLNDEFFYNYKEVHVCKMKIIEFVPHEKIVWEVLENQFNFTSDKNEWKGNRIVFRISEKAGLTRLDFTQIGLTPDYECYKVCNDAWTSYIQGSLKDLITTGKGKPNTRENDLNRELIEKWGLPVIKKNSDFTHTFTTLRQPEHVFALLLDIKQWWSGLYNESIKGSSKSLGDEFTFKAGDGAHYSKQKLVELVPGKRIIWQVTESRLTFLRKTDEWNDSKIRFDITKEGNTTRVTFTHEGLVPQIECFENCSSAWTGYLKNLEKRLR